jgi:ribosome biogenesis GTPase A
VQRAATTILKEFRSGLLGKMCLEWPERVEELVEEEEEEEEEKQA